MNAPLHRLLEHLCETLDAGRQRETDALDLGQPELNALDAISDKAAAKRLPLIRLAVSDADIRCKNAWNRFPTGVVLIHRAKDFETARAILREQGSHS